MYLELDLWLLEESSESQYYSEKDDGFANSMVCCLTVLLLLGCLQAVVLTSSPVLEFTASTIQRIDVAQRVSLTSSVDNCACLSRHFIY
ncbi:hypothetical protein TNCV_2647171 [Trichonephila clavipes]|nr:hypothetical protein TNCV_2647171 [Trichonephila clavipes]